MTPQAAKAAGLIFAPKPVDSQGNPYSDHLVDPREIADHIIYSSPHDVDDEFVEEFFRGSEGRLELVAIADLVTGSDDNNRPDESKKCKYARKNPATRPPLVASKGEVRGLWHPEGKSEIQDGHHRLRDAVARCETAVWCYMTAEPPAPVPEPSVKIKAASPGMG